MKYLLTFEEVQELYDEVYNEGFDDGVRIGRGEGYDDGYDQGYREARAIFAGTAQQPEVTAADLAFATDEIPEVGC